MEEKDSKNKKEECPLCEVSEETLKKLKEKVPAKETQEKSVKKKKRAWQKLFKK